MIPSFLDVIEGINEDYNTVPLHFINIDGEGQQVSFLIELPGTRIITISGIDNHLTGIGITSYAPDSGNSFISEYGGYVEKIVALGKVTESLTLTYCEGNVVKMILDLHSEGIFNANFEFETSDMLKIIGYEDSNGEYFDKEMTGEFFYPTLGYHLKEMLKRCKATYKVSPIDTTEKEHNENLKRVGEVQNLTKRKHYATNFYFNMFKFKTKLNG